MSLAFLFRLGLGGAALMRLLLRLQFSSFFRYLKSSFRQLLGTQYKSLSAPDAQKSKTIYALSLSITEKCTLRCQYCAHLMPYYNQPQDLAFDALCRDIDKLFSVADYIVEVNLVGGEPFVCKQLGAVIAYLHEHYRHQYAQLSLTTNATIVPDAALCQTLHDCLVRVNVSNYGKLSRNLRPLQKALSQNAVLWVTIAVGKTWREWCVPVRKGTVDAELAWKQCRTLLSCKFVKHGKLYFCPFLGNGDSLGLFADDESDSFVSLDAPAKAVWAYLTRTGPLEGCAHCGGSGKLIAAGAEQCKRTLERPF
ncbi:MAG: 4Fe-4S cluster-binding domain-containing protein [Oscillospiraceae bacterium]|jgi:hypothetical protein|nr:4Fe-4S cluster-binding domain-containing protein [Oscillospiraceae bacterium]